MLLFIGSIRVSQTKYSTKKWGFSPCGFVAVVIGLPQAKPWTDGDGDEVEGASLVAFEPEVEVEKTVQK